MLRERTKLPRPEVSVCRDPSFDSVESSRGKGIHPLLRSGDDCHQTRLSKDAQVPRHCRLRKIWKGRDQVTRRTASFPEHVEHHPSLRVRQGREDGVHLPISGAGQGVQDRPVFDGGWCSENMLPSGSAKVAEVPQGTS